MNMTIPQTEGLSTVGWVFVLEFWSLSEWKSGTQDGTQDGTQGDTQVDTQDDTQGGNLDKWIENQIRQNSRITTEELARKSNKGIATIKRHLAKLPHIRYVGSGYSGHWEVLDQE